MQATKLERSLFTFSRAGEYFEARELQTMTGQPQERFPDVVVKELIDNALDAAEARGVAPKISVRLLRRGRLLWLLVRDNGGGIAPEAVEKVLDFNTRTSDKAAYRAPTRGMQGNALKTVLGIPYALGARAPIYVESRGVRHRIEAGLNPAGQARVERDARQVPEKPGALFAVPLPVARCSQTPFARWARAFALFNPHAHVQIRNPGAAGKHAHTRGRETRNSYKPTVTFPGGWRKFLPTDLTSPWWYDDPAFGKLVFAHVGAADVGGPDKTLCNFVRQFRGLSPWAKAKAVCGRFPRVRSLADFGKRPRDLSPLLAAMQADTKAPSPDVLGEVGEGHFRQRFERWFGVKRWWYRKVAGAAGGVAYVVEVALAQTERPGRAFHGVNFSPTFDDPLAGAPLACPEFSAYGVDGFLDRGHARGARTAAAFHLVCPVVETLDKGKTRLKVPAEIAEAAGKALWSVARDLYREEERRKKDAARQERAERQRERTDRAEDWSLKRAVFQVIPQAVRDAAGDLGRVSAHTLYYHVRPLIQPLTSRELSSDYFEQGLLPAYQREVGPVPGVYYEPRGTLYEPHTGRAVPLGTREVESYSFPWWLYDKVLFVEKKGLWPVFQAARLAERYDMAIVAGEGYATEACRVLLASAERGREYKLAVLHDADPHGYNIGRTLREATARMPGHRVAVADLGLTLEEALAMGLPTEEFTRRKELPQGLRLSELEREYFGGRPAGRKSWVCRRVELNALSSPALIAYAERRLQGAGIRGKVIPPDAVLAQEFRSALERGMRERVAREYEPRIDKEAGRRLKGLRRQLRGRESELAEAVRRALGEDSSRRWLDVVTDEAAGLLGARPG